MGDDAPDAIVVARCVPLVAGIRHIFKFVFFDAKKVTRAFEHTVRPLIEQTISDRALRQHVHDALLGTSIKVGLAMRGYSTMAMVRFDAELTALGSAFTRVYDDLIDNFNHEQLEDRLTELFRRQPFQPRSDLEALLLSLYRSIETAIDRPPNDPLFEITRQLHQYQCQSREQLNPMIATDEITRITRGKGGLGLIALFALLRPNMSHAEQDVLMDLGDVLQLLDDHHDIALDIANGVTTTATRGDTTLTDLADRIRRLRTRFCAHYGRARDRKLATMLYLMLIGALLERRRNRRRPMLSQQSRKSTTLRFLFGRAENIETSSGSTGQVDGPD